MAATTAFQGIPSSLFHLSGTDAHRYLQSQLTCSLSLPGSGQWAYGLWLNDKGRVIADSYVYPQSSESCLIWSFYCPAEQLETAMTKHLVADEVNITDMRDELQCLILIGETLDKQIRKIGMSLPREKEVVETDDYFLYRQHRLPVPNAIWIAPPAYIENQIRHLRKDWTSLDILPLQDDQFEYLRIRAQLPAVPRDIGERNLPQEGRLENYAVDFRKGCFPGQEIMAKFRKGGKLNKSLFRFKIADEDMPDRPELPLDIHSGNLKVGTLTSLSRHDSHWLGLGLLRLRAKKQPLWTALPDGTRIEVFVQNES